jgi:cephalosporin hydroxylase
MNMASDLMLDKICERSMEEGLKIDLSDCPYGETTGPCPFIKRPANYYYLLAGLVRLERLFSILEIGTNFGGSIMSMRKGIREEDRVGSRLVTIDIVLKNDKAFGNYPDIERIEGDSLDQEVAKKAFAVFDKSIDLLYIDSLHEYEHTRRNIEIYADRLNPRYLALDDIRQCEDMRRLWSELRDRFGEASFDASDVSIRRGAGFGVIRWRDEI